MQLNFESFIADKIPDRKSPPRIKGINKMLKHILTNKSSKFTGLRFENREDCKRAYSSLRRSSELANYKVRIKGLEVYCEKSSLLEHSDDGGD